MQTRRLTDVHGVEVFSRWWPVEKPDALILLSHGASEHSGRYEEFAVSLNGANFAVAAVDHRGHGLTSDESTAVMGPGGGQAVVDDLHALRAAAQLYVGDEVPVFLFGHSMGAIIALAYLTQYSEGLAGGILMGVPAAVNEAAETATLLSGFDTPEGRALSAGDLLRSFNDAFEPARTPFDWLTRDGAEVDKYIADPLCGDDHPLTFGYLLDLFSVAAPAVEKLDAISCPLLLMSGDNDPSSELGTSLELLRERLSAAGVTPVAVEIYEGARHELLNETNRAEVVADIIDWLRRGASRPRGA